jgi:twitching motility protein PilT
VAQGLFKRIDKKGRVAALEIMLATPAVRNLIRESKTFQIPSVIQTGKKFGMQSLDDAIMDHMLAGRIDPDDAYNKCIDKAKFKQYITKPPDDFTDV